MKCNDKIGTNIALMVGLTAVKPRVGLPQTKNGTNGGSDGWTNSGKSWD